MTHRWNSNKTQGSHDKINGILISQKIWKEAIPKQYVYTTFWYKTLKMLNKIFRVGWTPKRIFQFSNNTTTVENEIKNRGIFS